MSRVLRRGLRRAGTAALVLVLGASAVSAQGSQGWMAQLILSPLPSPYLSDWEADPSVGELLVTNTTSTPNDITLHYSLTRGGQEILRGVTDPQPVGANETVVFNSMSTFGGRADWDRGVQDQLAQSGRLPEGEYEGCVTGVDPNGLVLVDRQCERFSLEYPDPPFLVFPMNGDTLTTQDPIFEWMPVQLSPTADSRVGYVLQISEVRTEAGQIPELALQTNIAHYYEPDLVQSSHQYPIGGMPFVPGRTYAWRVVALGGDGRPVASNQGQSEIWTFVYSDPQGELESVVASIELSARNDTLSAVGDTARLEARAYDANGMELFGKRLEWMSLDTAVVQVDGNGLVRGTGAGETRVVASADGVADSAWAVTAGSATYAIGFETYDAETDEPALLALVNSGPFEEVAPQLMERLETGTFRIPIPRLPGPDAALSTRGDGGGAGCPDVSFNVRDPYVDLDQQVFVFYIPLNRAQRQQVTNCLGTPDADGDVSDVDQARGALFVVSWKHPGLPRAVLAIKGIGPPVSLMGPESLARFLVLNVTAPVDVGADLLPTNYKGFFGDVTFEAGTGATFHSRRRCASTATAFCRLLDWFYPGNPAFTIDAFAGVTASEVSGGGTGGAGAGASLALGFSISAKLPVRIWDLDPLGVSLDSTQLGLTFAVQDSMVSGAGADTSASGNNWSIGVAPTLSVWITGRNGNAWQFDGSVGLEIDPTKPDSAPKLVVSGEIPARWKLWALRLGNPMLVFTKELKTEGAADLGISGTWGVGPWDGTKEELIGLDGGDAGFEEMGRGAVILKWEKPTLVPQTPAKKRSEEAQLRVKQAQLTWQRDSLTYTSMATPSIQLCLALRQRLPAAVPIPAHRVFVDNLPLNNFGSPTFLYSSPSAPVPDEITVGAVGPCTTAEGHRVVMQTKIRTREAEIRALRTVANAWANADSLEQGKPPAPGVPTCPGTLVFNNTRCFTWSARLSMGTASIIDLISLIVRMATGAG